MPFPGTKPSHDLWEPTWPVSPITSLILLLFFSWFYCTPTSWPFSLFLKLTGHVHASGPFCTLSSLCLNALPPDIYMAPSLLYSVSAQRSLCQNGPCWSLYIKEYPYHYSLSGDLTSFFLLAVVTITWWNSKMSETWVQATSTMLGNGTAGFSTISWWQPRDGPPHLW